MTSKAWFRIHGFTGVITGLLLFVVCWSGTFAVIAKELDMLVTPMSRVSSVPHNINDWVAWDHTAQAIDAAYPDASLVQYFPPLYEGGTKQAWVTLTSGGTVLVHVDPGTGEIVGEQSRYTVQRFFRSLHMSLFSIEFLGIKFGYYLVASLSFTLLASLIAALIFYKRWWTRFFERPLLHTKAKWSRLHRLIGIWSIWIISIMSITGSWYLYEHVKHDLFDGKTAYAGFGSEAVVEVPPIEAEGIGVPLSLGSLLQLLDESHPDLKIGTFVQLPDRLVVIGQAGDILVRDAANQIHIHRATGDILYEHSPDDYSFYWRVWDTVDPLHFGDFGGIWSKIVYFVFGLALSAIILTGTWLHAVKLEKSVRSFERHKWRGTLIALAITIGILFLSIPFGFQDARAFGPVVDGRRELPSLEPGVAAVIAGWLGLTACILTAWTVVLIRPWFKNNGRNAIRSNNDVCVHRVSELQAKRKETRMSEQDDIRFL